MRSAGLRSGGARPGLGFGVSRGQRVRGVRKWRRRPSAWFELRFGRPRWAPRHFSVLHVPVNTLLSLLSLCLFSLVLL